MASHYLLTFLNFWGPRAARTSTKANSWATICLWRQFFENEEQEKLMIVEEVLKEEFPGSPVDTEEARNALETFQRDCRLRTSGHHRRHLSASLLESVRDTGTNATAGAVDGAGNYRQPSHRNDPPPEQNHQGERPMDHMYLPQ